MHLGRDQALQCCASQEFATQLSQASPFGSVDHLIQAARHIWWHQVDVHQVLRNVLLKNQQVKSALPSAAVRVCHKVGIAGWLEAFAAHPRIGDIDGLKKKFGGFADMSKNEQSAASSASESTIKELAEWNTKYEAKYGHIFIICAAGKSADFMLNAIQSRCRNTPYKELSLAAAEQMKITEIRLRQILNAAPAVDQSQESAQRRTGQMRGHLDGKPLVSPVTSHVLDTARGQPAEGVEIKLDRKAPASDDIWEPVASGITNHDGRLPNFMQPSAVIEPGTYRVTFETGPYMENCKQKHPDFYADQAFYPKAAVQFVVTPDQTRQHFHIPLTWNPYGYSTYRGS